MRFKSLLTSAAAVAFASTGATMAAAEGAGYLQGHTAFEWGWSTNYNPDPIITYLWQDIQTGGAARAALYGSNLSVQGDAWSTLAFSGAGFDGMDWGTGAHLTWRSTNGAVMFGAFGAVGGGGFDSGVLANVGLEAVVNLDRWRFYAQFGVVNGITGYVQSNEERDIYATLSVNYFITPDMFLSANIGADEWTTINGDASRELSFGGKFEFRMDEASSLSFFVAYQGFAFHSTYGLTSDFDRGLDHLVFVGFRVPLGVDSLQDLQRNVGLADLNPMYGDLINR